MAAGRAPGVIAARARGRRGTVAAVAPGPVPRGTFRGASGLALMAAFMAALSALGGCTTPPGAGGAASREVAAAQARDAPDARDAAWVLPFQTTADRPMLEVTVNGQPGRVMFDTGTDDLILLNRDLARLDPGQPVAEGKTASGQPVTIRSHSAPQVTVAGRPLALGPTVRSGDFGFLLTGLRPDFLGFIGVAWVQDRAFVLDYQRQRLTLLPLPADRTLAVDEPAPRDVVARIALRKVPNELPLAAGAVADHPILIDFDTGDTTTFYLSAATLQAWVAAGRIAPGPSGVWRLDELRLGGGRFRSLEGRWVQAGGPDDHRRDGQPELLRLGSSFLGRHPTLWNLPAASIQVLHPHATWLTRP